MDAVDHGVCRASTGDGDGDLMARRGSVVGGGDGQVTFRIYGPSSTACASCRGGCTRSRVNEVVMKGIVLAPSSPVQACLYWSRRACNRAVAALYGLPLAGMTAAVLASSGMGGEGVLVPGVMTLAGLSIGLLAGRWLVVESAPRLEFESSPPHMSPESEDPGKKR